MRRSKRLFKVVSIIDSSRKVLTIRPYDPKVKPGDEVILGYAPATVIGVVKKRISELTEKHAELAECRSLRDYFGYVVDTLDAVGEKDVVTTLANANSGFLLCF